jgi:nitronate monooxygenase
MGIGISLSGLASAVANRGGVGVISTAGLGLILHDTNVNYKKNSMDAVRKEIRKARMLSRGIIGVNIMSVMTNFADTVRTSLEEGIDIIFSGAGLPLDLPGYLRGGEKTRLVPIVSSARAALIMCNKWKQNFDYLPDAFVVEGPKAGGHLGFKAGELQDENNKLENLVTEVLKVTADMKERYHKDIPVIAAGGIYTGYDMFKIIKLGASAVQLGTRFVATEECDASIEFKEAFLQAHDEDVRIIKSPVGMPGRAIYNHFLSDAYEGKRKPSVCKHHCIKSCNPKTTLYCIVDALLQAYRGNLSDGFAFTGANVGRVHEISTVALVMASLRREFRQAWKDDDKEWRAIHKTKKIILLPN